MWRNQIRLFFFREFNSFRVVHKRGWNDVFHFEITPLSQNRSNFASLRCACKVLEEGIRKAGQRIRSALRWNVISGSIICSQRHALKNHNFEIDGTESTSISKMHYSQIPDMFPSIFVHRIRYLFDICSFPEYYSTIFARIFTYHRVLWGNDISVLRLYILRGNKYIMLCNIIFYFGTRKFQTFILFQKICIPTLPLKSICPLSSLMEW